MPGRFPGPIFSLVPVERKIRFPSELVNAQSQSPIRAARGTADFYRANFQRAVFAPAMLGMLAAMHLSTCLALFAGAVVLVCAVALWAYLQRRKQLTAKYGDAEIARHIMQQVVWQGETAEQLRESFGTPADIDQKVLKTKSKEVWKYRPVGKNRFGLKVTLDDGVVVAWDTKD